MSTGLPIGDVIRGSVSLSPTAAQERNFGLNLFLGDSDVIDTAERMRTYSSSTQASSDFGINSPEFQAIELFFSQNPQPAQCIVGRWASTATKGLLRGAPLSPSQQAITVFNVINNGSLSISVDGQVHVATAIDLTNASNLNAVAAAIQTIIGGFASITWDSNNQRFQVESATSGTLSSVGFAVAPGSGTNLGPLLGLNNVPNSGAYTVPGIVAEDLAATVAKFMDLSADWYMLSMASTAAPSNQDYQKVAAVIEAASPSRIFGITNEDPSTLDPTINTDIASILNLAGYRRSTVLYTSQTDFAVASMLGRAATVDFDGADTTITLNFKQLPGVSPEFLTESQRLALRGKKCNAYLRYNNNTSILQEGWMASGDWFDAIHGTDWLLNACQTAIWNLYLTIGTKIPQTDQGLDTVVNTLASECEQGAVNGLIGRGLVWNGPNIATVLRTGDTLPKGYFIYAPKISTQSQADRDERKTPLIQVAVKLAGAFHSADFLISVNQ